MSEYDGGGVSLWVCLSVVETQGLVVVDSLLCVANEAEVRWSELTTVTLLLGEFDGLR